MSVVHPANYYRRRLIVYAIACGGSLLLLPVLYAAARGVRGHANLMVFVPLLGMGLAGGLALLFAVLWLATYLRWVRAGRPRPPFGT